MDLEKRTIRNFSVIVPENLKGEELTENFELLLAPNQLRLGIEYFTETEVGTLGDRLNEDGGLKVKEELRYLCSLPLHHLIF